MKTITKVGLLFASAFIFMQSCEKDEFTTPIDSFEIKGLKNDLVIINDPGLYPGKMDFNSQNNKFVVGSLSRSEVGFVHPVTGNYKTFIEDESLALVTGIHTDEERNRLIVASGDLGYSQNSVGLGGVSHIGIYDLRNGKKITGINLKEMYPEGTLSFANDIAVDTKGIIYITDSFNPVIHKIDLDYEISVFLEGGTDFQNAPIIGFALNGLTIVGDNLIVSKTDDGSLFRVPLSNPTNYSKIDLPAYIGADGLETTENDEIILVETGLGANSGARLLATDDDWNSAYTKSFFEITRGEFPASATLATNGSIYVLSSFFSKLNSGDTSQDTFSIYKVY